MTNTEETTGLEVAVIGLSGRFPGSKNIEELWRNLRDGKELINFFSDEELRENGISDEQINDPRYVKAKGFLDDAEYFDAPFFEYTNKEADYMDPQLRIFHECVYNALEDAGYASEKYPGSIGLFGGAGFNPFWISNFLSTPKSFSDLFNVTSLNGRDYLTTRVAYKLGLRGPAITVQTACSTSLSAIHLACQSLLAGECEMAMAGGVTVLFPEMGLPRKYGMLHEDGLVISPDGHCKPFDKDANGFMGGDGVGIVALKRLEDALEDGDNIYAVIKGSAINNDGRAKTGYTAPSVDGQSRVIETALEISNVDPKSIHYIETHGSGTPLGDAIEIEGLKQVFTSAGGNHCALGSIKSNIGHLDAAAGVAGFIKTVLSLKNKELPPIVNHNEANPNIDFENSPFYVNTTLKPWERNGTPRRAGVSSFGIGGSNAHIVLEEAPEVASSQNISKESLILLSAKTESALNNGSKSLLQFLKSNEHKVNLRDLAYTLQVGRNSFEYKRSFVCSDMDQLITQLSSEKGMSKIVRSKKGDLRSVVFVFSGLGGQYVNMGLDLYQNEPVFKEHIDHVFELVLEQTKIDLKSIVYPDQVDSKEASSLAKFDVAQLSVFAFEYAMTKLLSTWRIAPDAIIGYSFGEYTAACVAGVLTLKDALKVVIKRGQLTLKCPEGAMLNVPLTRDQLSEYSFDGLELAIDNGESCVLSGTKQEVSDFQAKMKTQRVLCMPLQANRAIHSSRMASCLPEFEEFLNSVTFNVNAVPLISNGTGTWVDETIQESKYWSRHLSQTVEFAKGVQTLLELPDPIYVEIGPGSDISSMMQKFIEDRPKSFVLNTCRPESIKIPDTKLLLARLQKLWQVGVEPDWEKLYSLETRRRISLPGYVFDKHKYWFKDHQAPIEKEQVQTEVKDNDELTKNKDIANWLHTPSWEQGTGIIAEEFDGVYSWLVLSDQSKMANALIDHLKANQQIVTVVLLGNDFERLEKDRFNLNPMLENQFDQLMDTLLEDQRLPDKILHLWSREELDIETAEETTIDQSIAQGFHCLSGLARASHFVESDRQLKFFIVTNGLHSVIGDEELFPIHANILGASRVLPFEFDNIKCVNIDLRRSNKENQATIDQINGELMAGNTDQVIAFRGRHRWVLNYKPLIVKKDKAKLAQVLGTGKVYVVAGGLCTASNLGFTISNYLAEKANASIVLLSRTAYPDRTQWAEILNSSEDSDVKNKIQQILRIEQSGGKVFSVSSDITDLDKLNNSVEYIEENIGAISGVINVSGVNTGKSVLVINDASKKELKAQFDIKVNGTVNLYKALKGKSLDFGIFSSSLSSIMGPFAAYAAGNSFIDSMANAINHAGASPWVSVNWDHLLGIDEMSEQVLAIDHKEIINVFERVIGLKNAGQVIISSADIQKRMEKAYGKVEVPSNTDLTIKNGLSKWYYEPTWSPRATVETTSPKVAGGSIVFLSDSKLNTALLQKIRESSNDLMIVSQGKEFKEEEGQYFIDPTNADHYDSLFKALDQSDFIATNLFHLWNSEDGVVPTSLENLDYTQKIGFESLVNIVKSISLLQDRKDITISVITNNLHSVIGTEDLAPLKASMLGPIKIIPGEDTRLKCLNVDVDAAEIEKLSLEELTVLTESIVRESSQSIKDYALLPFRKGQFYTKSYAQIVSKTTDTTADKLRENGVYLLTGGLGGMALEIAHHISDQIQATFLLLDNADFPERNTWDEIANGSDSTDSIKEKIRRIKAIEARSSKVKVCHVDISDRKSMEELMPKMVQEHGPINGVFHIAGMIDNAGMMQTRSMEETSEVMAPKLQGTLLLDQLLSDDSLDFAVYFSSTGNVFSRLKFGQVAYNAGHEFLDSYAYYRRRNTGIGQVVNWNDWHNTGIAGEAAKKHNFKLQDSSISFEKLLSIQPKEGLACLENILASDNVQTIISTFDLSEVENFINAINISDVAYSTPQEGNTSTTGERPELSTEYAAPESQTHHDLIEIFNGIFGIDQIGIDDDFFEMGGDSIKAISAISLLQRNHGLDVPVTTFFKARTIRNISEHLHSETSIVEEEVKTSLVKETKGDGYYQPFPLTPIQMAYFMGRRDHFEMGGISTNVYQEGEISVDLTLLNDTFNTIVQRHPMLKAIFLPDGTQKFIEVDSYEIGNKDLRNLSAEEQQVEIQDSRSRLNNHVFKESEWPLFEISTFTLSDKKSYIFFCLDHIICDAHSILLFVKEWDSLLREPNKVLPQLNYTFQDYILEHESLKESEKYKVSKNYWMGRLDDFPLAPSIPFKCDPASVKKPKFKRRHKLFDKKDWETLQSISRTNHTTPSVLLSAAYAKVLAAWSGRDQVSINLTLFNRYPFHDDVPNIVGDFTMLLMLGLDFSAHDDFLEDVSMVQQTMLESLDNRFFDGVDFIREFRKRHKLGIQAVMPYVFTSALFGNELTDPNEVEILNFWRAQRDSGMASSQTSQVYLDCTASEMNGGLELVWDYVEDIFEEEVINLMFDHFITIIQNALKGENALDITLEDKYQDLVSKSNSGIGSNGHDVHTKHKEYWLEQFKDGVPALDLPTTFPRKVNESFSANRQHFEIDASVANQLRELESQSELEVKEFMFSAFLILLSKITGQERVIVGSSSMGAGNLREPKGNTDSSMPTPYIAEVVAGDHWHTFLEKVANKINSNLEYAEYSFLRVLQDLDISFNPKQTPLFEVLFDIYDTDSDVWKSEYLAQEVPQNRIEFSFTIVHSKDDMIVAIDFDSSLFSEQKVRQLFSYYLTTITGILAEVDMKISDIQILPEIEQDKILFGFNDTKVDYATDRLIHELFEEQVLVNPEAIALVYDKTYITYDQLNKRSNQLAHHLRSLGVTNNTNVGLVQSRSDNLIVTLLGILKAGGVYVPLEPYLPQKRIEKILNAVGCDIAIIGEDQEELFRSLIPEVEKLEKLIVIDKAEVNADSYSGNIQAIGYDDLNQCSDENLKPVASPVDNAYIIFTSGTTGDPKGVVVQHQPVINLIEWVTGKYNFSKDDRVLFTTSVSFDLSVFDVFGLLASGGSVFVLSSSDIQDPASIARELVNNKITFWDSAPQAFQQVISYMQHEAPEGEYSDLRLSFSSGDWVPLQLPENIRHFFPNCHVVALGGATEATVWSNYFDVADVEEHWASIPYGKPIQNAKYFILDEGLNPTPVGTPGYLYIGGQCLAKEYYGDETLSSRKFIDSPFCLGEKVYFTGDRARWFEDGNIEFLGRLDDQVKIRGYRVELGEIESHLLAHDSIKEGVVIAKKHDGNNYLVSYIVADEKVEPKELRELLLTSLPDYMVPYYYVHLDSLPLTSNGKLNKNALPEPEIGTEGDHVPPSTKVEKILAAIWAGLLDIEESLIGVNDSFFELGGHSLKATILINKIDKEFSVVIPLTEIFSKDTIRQQSQFIETSDWLNTESDMVSTEGKSEMII